MSIRSTRKRVVGSLLVVLPIVTAGGSRGEGCWVESVLSPTEEFCQEGKICVEWEVQGESFATACCSDPPLACTSCASAGRVIQIRADPPPAAPLKDDAYARHTAPRIPVLVDQVPVPREDFGRFDGTPLHFLVCSSEAGAALQAFSTREGLASALGECRLGQPSFVVREVPAEADAGVVFYEGRKWRGAPYHLPAGQSMALADTWWDDRPASLRGYGEATVVTLFENADLAGSTLTLTSDLAWPDLGMFGWQGRVSALLVWPVARPDGEPYLKDSGE